MEIEIVLGIAAALTVAYCGIWVYRRDAKKKRECERVVTDRKKDLEALGRELEYKILEPLQGAPNLFRATVIKTSIVSDLQQEGNSTHEIDKIVVDFSFTGRGSDFEMVKVEYVRTAISEFMKENPGIFVRLNPTHQLNAN